MGVTIKSTYFLDIAEEHKVVGFEVLTSVVMKSTVFWDIMP
jgi:hypothetical protein